MKNNKKEILQKKIQPLLFLLFLSINSFGQTFYSDRDLIENKEKIKILPLMGNHKFLNSDSPSKIIKYNPFNLFFGGLMYSYQMAISPQISASCPYQPTCSGYSKMAISKFGLFEGILLSADRLMRCNHSAIKESKFDVHTGKIIDYP